MITDIDIENAEAPLVPRVAGDRNSTDRTLRGSGHPDPFERALLEGAE